MNKRIEGENGGHGSEAQGQTESTRKVCRQICNKCAKQCCLTGSHNEHKCAEHNNTDGIGSCIGGGT